MHGALQLHLSAVTIRDVLGILAVSRDEIRCIQPPMNVSLILLTVQPLPLRQVAEPSGFLPPWVILLSMAPLHSLFLSQHDNLRKKKGEDHVPNRCSGSGGWRRRLVKEHLSSQTTQLG